MRNEYVSLSDSFSVSSSPTSQSGLPARTALLDDATRERLAAKYAAALAVLEPTA